MATRIRLAHRTPPWVITSALVGLCALSSCAAFNRGELTMVRNISIGQELIDLKRAQTAGAIDEAEFNALKAKVMEMADSLEVVKATDDYVPDQISKPDDD